jgi:ubiquinone/menaquinone biosynthesis C-methylase UbiE
MMSARGSTPSEDPTDRARRHWDRQARSYDRSMRPIERLLLGDSRAWVCSQAGGRTLEVGVGTGLNLPLYPEPVQLTGIDFSPGMLAIARQRAAELGRAVDLREADAQHLPFSSASFDTVVSTLSLCSVPDEKAAIVEMRRVLRPGGRLLLLDHIRPSLRPLRWALTGMQWLADRFARGNGEQFLRRPLETVVAQGFALERQERFRGGALERLAARKPA